MTIHYIYKYENKINGHSYIGQTNNIDKRKREHRNASQNPNHKDYNLPIHRAITKYGEDNFIFSILEECSSQVVNERERYWIAYYNSYSKGYNATIGGQDGGGYNGKKVLAFDYQDNYVKSFDNAKQAAIELGLGYGVVQQVLHQQRKSCRGYQLKYEEDPREITVYNSRQGGTISILQFDKNNNFIKEWKSAAEAGRTLKLDNSSITKCLKGKIKSCGGFIWKYKESENI